MKNQEDIGQKKDDTAVFIISLIGQLVLLAYTIPIVAVAHYFLLVVFMQVILLVGFCTRNKFFIYACTGLFALGAFIFAVMSFSMPGFRIAFAFAIVCSFFGRMTYKVAEMAENKHEQYQLE
jgi:hypothetical protein